jgi:ribosomal-protein-alanine N-acetyltransferase
MLTRTTPRVANYKSGSSCLLDTDSGFSVRKQHVIQTERLGLRRFDLDDAPFILDLVNEPDWLRFIGDKGVSSLGDAQRYLQAGPLEMYARLGFGLYLVERRADGLPIGMCGLVKRETLECVDIGFAFLARYRRQGFALEAAKATLAHARDLGLQRLMAITTRDNVASKKLLGKLGMTFDREIATALDAELLHLFTMDLNRGSERVHPGG